VRHSAVRLAAETAVSVMGFGFSFYGFFAAAAVWIALYFLWLLIVEARERRREGR
jgi:hypothetical protein